MERELGTQFYHAGLYSPDCYLGTTRCLDSCDGKRLTEDGFLFEHSPVVKLDLQLGKWRVLTPHGADHN